MIWLIISIIAIILFGIVYYLELKKSKKLENESGKPPDDIYPLY